MNPIFLNLFQEFHSLDLFRVMDDNFLIIFIVEQLSDEQRVEY